MKYIGIISLLFISLTSLAQVPRFTADTSSATRNRLIPGEYTFSVRPDGSVYILRKNLPPARFTIPASGIPGLASKLDSLRGLSKPASYVPSFTEITAKPSAYSSTIPLVAGLADSLATRVRRRDLDSLLAAANDSTYSPALIESKLQTKAPLLETVASLASKPTDATVSQVRSWTAALPASFAVNGGIYKLDLSDATSPDNTGTVLVTGSGYRYKRDYKGEIYTSWFGSRGDGETDDRNAIQTAINYASSLTATNGGTYRSTVVLPAGYYYLSQPLDLTDRNGVWLRGESGKYINTVLVGMTSGPIVDLSGSTMSGIEGITLLSSGSSSSRSTIGVLLSLTQDGSGVQKGGLNTSLRNVFIQLNDNPTANGGLGSIGILNNRSEEWACYDAVIQANRGVVLTTQRNLTPLGATSFTISSAYATLAADVSTGSMGVSTFSNVSIQNVEKRGPGLTLYNANSVFFTGYISRVSSASGTDETAIWAGGSCSNLNISATVESFSRLLRIPTAIEMGTISLISANITALGTPLVDITGASLIQGLTLKVAIPNGSERAGRFLLWHEANANGTEPISTYIKNSTFTCNDLAGNEWAMPGWVAQRCDNVTLDIFYPIQKRGGAWHTTGTKTVSLGNKGAVSAAAVLQLTEAGLNDGSNGKSGGYSIAIEGIITCGAHYIGTTATRAFRATIVQNQTNLGDKSTPVVTVTLGDQSATNTSEITISGVSLALSFSSGVGTVTLTPTLAGSASGSDYPVTYSGSASVRALFHAQDPIIIN